MFHRQQSRLFQRWRSPTYSQKAPPKQRSSCSGTAETHLSTYAPTSSIHHTTSAMRFHTQPLYAQTLRYYAQSTRATKADRLGAAVTLGYCCLAFSAPFAGAALVSKNAKKDDRYANLYVPCITSLSERRLNTLTDHLRCRRPLSFRDCLPGSPLEDYAGMKRMSW
jgi:hypothetical protein